MTEFQCMLWIATADASAGLCLQRLLYLVFDKRDVVCSLLQRPEATSAQPVGPPAAHRDAQPMSYTTLMNQIGGLRRHHMSVLTDRVLLCHLSSRYHPKMLVSRGLSSFGYAALYGASQSSLHPCCAESTLGPEYNLDLLMLGYGGEI